ncbi:BnaC05g44560D [Brassica napus]|uniref:BnaC05g44560D protein n=1 Tax=Brassica napus TaxID=3708 RepID=A0A078GSB7_BRANA|nr:BnaC05g44560D [Brassica napus]
MPQPKVEDRDGFVINCLEAPLDVDIKDGGRVVVLNTKNLPLVGEVGFGADLFLIDGHSMCSPGFSCDSALQVTCTLLVGVEEFKLFFVVSKIADPEGMSWFSIVTTPDPNFTHLAGRTSVWKALSPEVLQAAFKVDAEVEQLFRSKRTSDAISLSLIVVFSLSL